MIVGPSRVKLRRNFERPSDAVVSAFSATSTSMLADAMGGRGCLDFRIKPINPAASTFVGVAMTALAGPADNLALWAALDAARPGDVIVLSTDHHTKTAVTGDLFVGLAKNRGLAALVTDGLVRDLAEVLEIGLPVYCAGVSANSPHRHGPAEVGLPITIGGVSVAAGDIVAGDRDGVVVVPLNQASAVLARLPEIRRREADLTEQIKQGRTTLPSFVSEILQSGSIEEIE